MYAVGDKNLKDKAYGCMQIRQPACDDVNERYGTTYKAQDMLGNKEKSLDVFRKYTTLDNPNPTSEERMRIWNGGRGWKSLYKKNGYDQYTKQLDAYVEKVKAVM